jgi:hypothetical protein
MLIQRNSGKFGNNRGIYVRSCFLNTFSWASVSLPGFFHIPLYMLRMTRQSLSKPSIKFGKNNEMTAVEMRSFGLR